MGEKGAVEKRGGPAPAVAAVGALHPPGSRYRRGSPSPRYLLVLVGRHGGELGLLEGEGLHPLGRQRLDLR